MRILQRYVLSDLLRIFGLAISVLTVLLVFMGVAGEAAKHGLLARQIMQIIPWIIPSLLPYTIPATLLLTVCIVYGRMAGDHEIWAIKAAGINVIAVLGPSFVMGALLSLATFVLTDQFVPLGQARIEQIVALAMEDIFFDVLRVNNTYNDTRHGITIAVKGVDDRARKGPRRAGEPERAPRLIDPIFRYRLQGGEVATISASEAEVHFDMHEQQVWLTLHDGQMETPGGQRVKFQEERQAFPMPAQTDALKAPRNMTIDSLRREMAGLIRDREEALQRQVIRTVLALSEGAFDRLSAAELRAADAKENQRAERYQKLRTEIHGRVALSCSCFIFVLIGSPFAIIWGKRQFLTNFALCFAPILLGYYPIVLLTMNLCRDGVIEPAWGMWVANAGLLAAAVIVLRKALRN
jgi:lipopolysaccharide export system permease protein